MGKPHHDPSGHGIIDDMSLNGYPVFTETGRPVANGFKGEAVFRQYGKKSILGNWMLPHVWGIIKHRRPR